MVEGEEGIIDEEEVVLLLREDFIIDRELTGFETWATWVAVGS